MRRSVRWALAGVALLVLATVAGACGGGMNDGAVFSTYSNRDYGFSIRYPAGWVKATKTGTGPSDARFAVFFADGDGAVAGGQAVDVIAVSVYEVNKPVTMQDVKAKQREFGAMALDLVGKPSKLRIVEPPTIKTVAGQPAVSLTYTSRISGKDVAAMSTLVFKGNRAYWLTGQASRATWPTMGRLLASSIATLDVD
jgi:hypothetical protein